MADQAEAPDGERDALGTEIDGLLATVEKETADLDRYKRAEKALAARAQPVTPAPIVIPAQELKFKPTADLFIRGAVCALQAHYEKRSPLAVAAERYKDDEIAAFMVALTTKAAQPPATTFTPSYAAELVRQTYAAWMGALAMVSVLARLPFRPENFDGGSPIIFPMRNESAAFPANFEAMWRKEGEPIRVGVLSMTSKEMKPYSAGVIGHFTKELLRRSTPSIESIIREAIVEDTGVAMDAYFFSNSAAVPDTRPPGIANGIDPADTRPSSGVTAANVDADLQGMVNQLLIGRRLGVRPVWVMNMINAAALGTVAWPFGALVYPGMANLAAPTGTLKGFPVYVGNNVPVDQIYLIDAAQVAFAGGTPAWEVSDQATIHEETQTPQPIGSAGTPAVVAAPVRSLFQTHSAAVKAVYELSWLALRAGAVQVLTGVTWGTTGITPPVIATTPAP
jgi:hypothetical protein